MSKLNVALTKDFIKILERTIPIMQDVHQKQGVCFAITVARDIGALKGIEEKSQHKLQDYIVQKIGQQHLYVTDWLHNNSQEFRDWNQKQFAKGKFWVQHDPMIRAYRIRWMKKMIADFKGYLKEAGV